MAIEIPVFTRQLERSRESTDLANIRSAYAEVVTDYLSENNAATATVKLKQTVSGWNYEGDNSSTAYIGTDIATASVSAGRVKIEGRPDSGGSATITVTTSGDVSISIN